MTHVKQYFRIGLLILCIVYINASSTAMAGYFLVGAGYGGEAETSNVTILEFGVTEIELNDTEWILGVGVPLIIHGYDNIPSTMFDKPAPHDDIRLMKKEYEGTEVGLYTRLGVRLFQSDFFFSVIGGASQANEIIGAQSKVTGWYYEQASDKVYRALWGGGIGYFAEILENDVCLQLDYDNRRGGIFNVGLFW